MIEVAANERVQKRITELYEVGLGGGKPGSVGLKAIADFVGCQDVRKPRRKVSVMLIGNHSAGKSSFINWYIGEQVCKTGVAIETRGFIFVTSGRKRETLRGDATLRYFDHLAGLDAFEGMLANLFTEISTSRERAFTCVDFVDTPGLVDGDMQYPFDVQEAIVWMAAHVDLILCFFDPIGQATCKRTLQVVERLNSGPHVDKVHYMMSKADEVDKESDRQRVLIQITQNLATRIRNSHAFNLPTFYLPHEDGLPSPIPNAIEDVCGEVDKAISLSVQKNLRALKGDCARVQAAVDARLAADAANKRTNRSRTRTGLLLLLLAAAATALLAGAAAALGLGSYCAGAGAGAVDGGGAWAELCRSRWALELRRWAPPLQEQPGAALGGLAAVTAALLLLLGWVWRAAPALSKREVRRLEDMRAYVGQLALQEAQLLSEYFATLAHDAEER